MQKRSGHIILLGGIGGDAHSVGLNILRHTLSGKGYRVLYLGTQNQLEEFFQLAGLANVVMISSMDGHARYYMQSFPELMKQYKTRGVMWYLGGNLEIGDAAGYESYFLEAGLDRVFTKFVDINSVLAILERDLHGVEPKADSPTLWERLQQQKLHQAFLVSDEMLEMDTFKRIRREVLECWKTGYKAKSLEENADFLVTQPSYPRVQSMVNAGRLPILVQPRSGVPLVDEQIRLFKAFKAVGVPVVSYQVDSLTRNNNYVAAEEAIRESAESGISTINGFPVINCGVPALRRIISEVKIPIQTRHSTRDPRLLAEISYAGGVTAFEGGPICYNIPYYKDYPLDESLLNWQYVDRLTGLYYDDYGISLDREFFGTLTATLIPPCLAIAINIIEAVLAVQQRVRCVSLGYAEQGNRIQDIAAVRVMGQMAAEILKNFGHKDIQINTVFHQYMAAFPDDSSRADDLIYNSAVTAALSGATRVIIKTPAEAYKIPVLEDNLHGIALAMSGIASAKHYLVDEKSIAEECAIIRAETQALIDSIILCGNGKIAEGVVKGFKKGYLDIPFSPSIHNRGEVMTARDTEGAVRFLSTGSLQFDRESREFNESKMQERRRAEGVLSENKNYLLIEKDVMQIARGQYRGWPIYGSGALLQESAD